MATRKLESQVSNPDAPEKKQARGADGREVQVESAKGSHGDDEDMASMMKKMMTMMQGLQNDMKDVKKDLGQATHLALDAKKVADKAMQVSEMMKDDMANIKKNMITKQEIPAMVKDIMKREAPETVSGVSDPVSVIFGGFEGANSVVEAAEWVNDKLTSAGLPPIINAYVKSDKIENIFFAKFPSKKTAEAGIDLFRQKGTSFKEKTVWCNFDRPVHHRVPLRVLFKLKRLLSSWGFQKSGMVINDETMVMTIGGSDVVKATSKDGSLAMEWLTDEWKEWKELHESQELQDAIAQGHKDLQAAHQRHSKGLGKGKPQE
jgi:hypothetical protein